MRLILLSLAMVLSLSTFALAQVPPTEPSVGIWNVTLSGDKVSASTSRSLGGHHKMLIIFRIRRGGEVIGTHPSGGLPYERDDDNNEDFEGMEFKNGGTPVTPQPGDQVEIVADLYDTNNNHQGQITASTTLQ